MGFKQWRQSWKDLRARLRRVTWEELSSGERMVRFVLDIGRLAALRLRRHRAGMMAAALSYRVLFSLLPLLALAASIARLSVTKQEFLDTVSNLVTRLGLERVDIPTGAHAGSSVDLGHWLESLAAQAAEIDVTGMTWIGAIVLIWAAYRLFDEVEASLSVIVAGNKRRSAIARVLVSLLILVLAPALSVWGIAVLGDLVSEIEATGYRWVAMVGNALISLILIWLIVLLAYRFVPAGRKGWGASSIGALVAAISLLIGQWLLRRFFFSATSASPIGGSLGMVPLLMIWVYVMWICVLYGAELAAMLDRARWRWRSVRSLGRDAATDAHH
ncbi:MAG: YihY/virulence factor BrkB family protein [Phycisphaerales bacterium]|nr:YihY/virulence factor BrkB family protein [Phycisphaerales bacterium]